VAHAVFVVSWVCQASGVSRKNAVYQAVPPLQAGIL
jgi:hypothetical protein